ncbi:MAG: DUF2061 domain-containing protein [Pirellulaceae bacterium]
MIKKSRSLAKAFSWRIFASCITVIVVWFFTRDLKTGITVGGGDFALKLIAYYGHERIWANIKWGRGDQDPQVHLDAG